MTGGIVLLMVILAILSAPSFLAISLDRERAQQEILHYLKWQAGTQLMAEVRATGLRAPNEEQANRWKERAAAIDHLEFVSVEIRHFLFVPPSASSRMFMVKVVSRDPNQKEQTRYFSLSSRNKFFNVFLVAEQTRLMWLMSI
jgi:hypothetical protein